MSKLDIVFYRKDVSVSHLMGVDLGFGNIKLYDKNGATTYASHVSVATGERFADAMGDGQSVRAAVIEFSDNRFYTGHYAGYEGVSVGNLGLERLVGSLEIRALLYSALSKHMGNYSKLRNPLTLYVGLPFSMLKESDASSVQSSMEGWLLGDHWWKYNGESFKVNVESIVLKPQAAGALFDYILNIDGAPNGNAGILKSEVGIVSIGYNTIELMVLNGGKQVDRMGGSDMLGVRRLLELLNKGKMYTLTELDTLLRDNRLNGEMKSGINAWSEMVTAYISTAWAATWKRFGKVIVVGGGATPALLSSKIDAYFDGKAVVPSDPIQSIARGLYKRGVADAKRRG